MPKVKWWQIKKHHRHLNQQSHALQKGVILRIETLICIVLEGKDKLPILSFNLEDLLKIAQNNITNQTQPLCTKGVLLHPFIYSHSPSGCSHLLVMPFLKIPI